MIKGKITLQPIRAEKLKISGWPVFSKEEANFGHVKNKTAVIKGGDKIPFDDIYEFMVRSSEDNSLFTLNPDNIDEAADNDWWDYYQDGKELDFQINDGVATVVINPVEIGATNRGFFLGQFEDDYGQKCSIQMSSIATRRCIWLGIDDADPKIMASDARKVGIKTSETTGWIPYPIPEGVLLHTRMHLSREDVKRILPLLTKFAETGEL